MSQEYGRGNIGEWQSSRVERERSGVGTTQLNPSLQRFGTKGEYCDPRLDISDAVVLLIDHQTGLLNLVKDMDVDTLRTNVVSLLRASILADIPVFVSTCCEDGPNGPVLPEFKHFKNSFKYIERKGGEVNPWHSKELVNVFQQLNKKTIIMAGTLTNICLALPAISAVADGFKVYAVVDSSGGSSYLSTLLAIERMAASGVIPSDTMSIITELMQTYHRKDIYDWFDLSCEVMPRFKLLIESFNHANSLGTGTSKFYGKEHTQHYSRFEPESRFEKDVGGRFTTEKKYV